MSLPPARCTRSATKQRDVAVQAMAAKMHAVVTALEQDWMCGQMGDYMPLDVSRAQAPWWSLLAAHLNDAVELCLPDGIWTGIANVRQATPAELNACADILTKESVPQGFGRNPLAVARRMLAAVDPGYCAPAKTHMATRAGAFPTRGAHLDLVDHPIAAFL